MEKRWKKSNIPMTKDQIKELNEYIEQGLEHLPYNINNFVSYNLYSVANKTCENYDIVDKLIKSIVNNIAMRDYDFTADFIRDPEGTIRKRKLLDINNQQE